MLIFFFQNFSKFWGDFQDFLVSFSSKFPENPEEQISYSSIPEECKFAIPRLLDSSRNEILRGIAIPTQIIFSEIQNTQTSLSSQLNSILKSTPWILLNEIYWHTFQLCIWQFTFFIRVCPTYINWHKSNHSNNQQLRGCATYLEFLHCFV